jgi:hypothetical protein
VVTHDVPLKAFSLQPIYLVVTLDGDIDQAVRFHR